MNNTTKINITVKNGVCKTDMKGNTVEILGTLVHRLITVILDNTNPFGVRMETSKFIYSQLQKGASKNNENSTEMEF